MEKNTVFGINGTVVTVKGTKDFAMQEMVLVGHDKMVSEVIEIRGDDTIIQVYELTSGVKQGEPVYKTNSPMSIALGPGLLGNIFDGIGRPLKEIEKKSGAFIAKGSVLETLDLNRKWDITVTAKLGEYLYTGQAFAHCEETLSVTHYAMVPPAISGKVTSISPNGSYTVAEPLIEITDDNGMVHKLPLMQKWTIRSPRPIAKRLAINKPLITGQRIIDTLFPIAKGGAAAIPGGFGTGKTMTQHQLAKWCDADIIIYVGCGERGNEMTQVLDEFGDLIDPRSGRKLSDRTVLIANTSNMPVSAREASIYTGVTLAEYYRDMGYDVALMADSTSRWAEALREISGRLEEMPAEEGFPAYLSSRLSQFYERAGYIETLGGKSGSVTIIGAVSPQGADFSEPVTQYTKRFTRCFWTLDKSLAYARHYPAINWNTSFSEYERDLRTWYEMNININFMKLREKMMALLRNETYLAEVVKLIGADTLPDSQRLIIEVAKIVRIGFLQQNAFHKTDTYASINKQYNIMKTIMHLYDRAQLLISECIPIRLLADTGIYEKLIRMKFDTQDNDESYIAEINSTVNNLLKKSK